MHGPVPPVPPWTTLMFRLSSGFKCVPDPGACGRVGALGRALLHREREGVADHPAQGSHSRGRALLSRAGDPGGSQGANKPWRNGRLPRRQPVAAGFHMLFHSEKLPEVSIPGRPFVSSSCT